MLVSVHWRGKSIVYLKSFPPSVHQSMYHENISTIRLFKWRNWPNNFLLSWLYTASLQLSASNVHWTLLLMCEEISPVGQDKSPPYLLWWEGAFSPVCLTGAISPVCLTAITGVSHRHHRCVSPVCLTGVSYRCVSPVCLTGVSYRCVSPVCLTGQRVRG